MENLLAGSRYHSATYEEAAAPWDRHGNGRVSRGIQRLRVACQVLSGKDLSPVDEERQDLGSGGHVLQDKEPIAVGRNIVFRDPG